MANAASEATSGGAGSTGSRRLTPEARRSQIIAAAREVFLRHGFAGTRVRDIAAQAGITDNWVYMRFATKAAIYEAAVTEPLDAMVDELIQATGDVTTAGPSSLEERQRVLERFHRVMLAHMLEAAPLLAVALFSDPEAGRRYYREVVLPRFTDAVAAVIGDITGWPPESLRLDLMVEAVLGLHFGLALDSVFDEHAVDPRAVARQLAVIFGSGITDEPHPTILTPAPAPNPASAAALVESPAAPGEPERSRTRMPAAQRRAQIAGAAREVFVERGPAGARTREIAERAGITEAFMFRVFNGKEELYREAIEQPAEVLLARLETEMRRIAEAGDGGVPTLAALIQSGLTVLDELAPILVVALFSDMDRGRRFYRRAVIPALRGAEGYLAAVPGWDTTGVDPEILWRAIFGVQFGTVVHHLLTGEPLDASRTGRRLTRLIALGIR
jgi:AcrR family transcriptional regulator